MTTPPAMKRRQAEQLEHRWRSPWPGTTGVAVHSKVQPVAQLFAGLEVGHDLVRNLHLVAGAGIAPTRSRARADREGTEATQLHPVAAGQGRADLLEHAPTIRSMSRM